MATKKKLVGAKKGHELLKKKADALKKKFREVMVEIVNVRYDQSLYCRKRRIWERHLTRL